jgi:uncharacterized protein
MARPCCLRRIAFRPDADFFKPAGIPARELELVTLTLDEVEALRLADLNGLYQERAAVEMAVSRSTFSRIIEEARRKVADALIHGKALRLEGGAVTMKGWKPMPGRDGTGPTGTGPGMGRGLCGCGQRRRTQGQPGSDIGPGRGRRCRAAAAPLTPQDTTRTQPIKGEQES